LRTYSGAIGGFITANSKASAKLLAGENTQQGQRFYPIYKMLNSFFSNFRIFINKEKYSFYSGTGNY
jgi:hypothetical protein